MADDPRKITPCMDCGEKTNPREPGVHLECYGFAEYRGTAGGTNNLKFKKFTGKVICPPCVAARQNGTKGMDSMF